MTINELAPVWDWLRDALTNIDFRAIGAIVGPLAAAYFGAYSAQRIIERRETRQRLLKEIRSSNVAATLAFSTANTFFNIKKQHIRALHESYHTAKKAVLAASEPKSERSPPQVVEFKADLAYLTPPTVPVDQLQSVITADVSVTGRPLVLPSMLTQAVRNQAESLLLRNNLINSIKAQRPSHGEFASLYFGLKTDRGVDDTYGATIDAIHKYTDDCIYFSTMLSKDLTKHTNELRRKYTERFSEDPPKAATADFAKAEKDGLLPPSSEYSDWETMFQAEAPGAAYVSKWRFWKRKG